MSIYLSFFLVFCYLFLYCDYKKGVIDKQTAVEVSLNLIKNVVQQDIKKRFDKENDQEGYDIIVVCISFWLK